MERNMIIERKVIKKVAITCLVASLYALPSWAGPMIPFSLPSLDGGKTISSTNYKGKVMIVDFWASWCGPCKASFAAYNELLTKYGSKGLVIVGINIDNDPEKAKEFLGENPASFHIASDPNKKVAAKYNLPTMPTAYIIGRSGDILYTHAGYHEGDLAGIEQEVETALGQSEKETNAPSTNSNTPINQKSEE